MYSDLMEAIGEGRASRVEDAKAAYAAAVERATITPDGPRGVARAFLERQNMKPKVRELEDQATRAYFRRYGSGGQQPNKKATKVFEQDGKHYIRLSNDGGPLATYRITEKAGGAGWRLNYVIEKHESEIE
jgi:hypothetical protein